MIGVITYLNEKQGLILGTDHINYTFSIMDIVNVCELKEGLTVKFKPVLKNIGNKVLYKATYVRKLSNAWLF